MDKKSKILFIVFGLIILGSVVATYYRIMIKKDYIIEAQIDCDPAVNKCFVWKCDPTSDVDGEKCTGDPDEDSWNYNVLKRSAKNIPDCDPKAEDCTAYICSENEPECEYIYCDDKTKLEQKVECSEPVVEEEAIIEENVTSTEAVDETATTSTETEE